MTDTRIKDRDRRRAAALRANLARRKALARGLGSEDAAQAQAGTGASAAVAGGDGGVDGGDHLG
jgi:hypothetical protein